MAFLACALPRLAHAHGAEGDSGGSRGGQSTAEPRNPANETGYRFAAGVFGTALASFGDTGPTAVYGGGAFIKAALIPGELDLELQARVLKVDAGALEVPLTLLIKKPFHLTRHFEGFAGIGPTVVPDLKLAQAGAALTLGAYIWFTDRIGLLIAAHYNILYNVGTQAIANELGATAGIAFGF